MTKRQAWRKTLAQWVERAESGEWDSDFCGFCDYDSDHHVPGEAGCTHCPFVVATRYRDCDSLKIYKNWDIAETTSERRKWARHVVAYLKRLGKREGWDK